MWKWIFSGLLAVTLAFPATSALGQAPSGENPLKRYRVAPDRLQETADSLKEQYRSQPEVKIAVDARTSSIIVMGSDDVHRQIGAALTIAPETPAPTVALTLQNLTSRQLTTRLQQLLGERIQLIPAADNQAIRVATSESTPTDLLRIEVSRPRVHFVGPEATRKPWQKIVRALDEPPRQQDELTHLSSWSRANPAEVRRAVSILADGDVPLQIFDPTDWNNNNASRLVAKIFQGQEADDAVADEAPPAEAPADGEPADGEPADGEPADGEPADGEPAAAGEPMGSIGDVQVEFVEGMDIVIIRGRRSDVDRIARIIDDIERMSAETKPVIDVHLLKHANSQAVTQLVNQVNESVLATRHGPISIVSLNKPNGILLVGRADAVENIKQLIRRLDQPVVATSQFRVFRLQHVSAADVQAAVTAMYPTPTGEIETDGLSPRVVATVEFRSNSLIVQAGPRDMLEVQRVVEQLDVATSESKNEIRIFRLNNALAADLAPVLQDAINWQLIGTGGPPGATPGTGAESQTRARLRSAMLSFMSVDGEGGQLYQSGILTDVRVTADERANALVVTAPAESMPLIEALIQELDRLPASGAQIKVFTVINGDATRLGNMLANLFGQTVATGASAVGGNQAAGTLPPQSATGSGESSLVPLRFGVDERTNSIIVTGNEGDLNVIEAILVRLDEHDIRKRRTAVYRLRNAVAVEVATAVTDLLTQERQQLQQAQQQFSLVTPNDQIDQQVFVVAEAESNSLIVSATPRYFEEIKSVVEALDRRKQLVKIDILVAEVTLTDLYEFGSEFGLQDQLLFDRGVPGGAGASTPGFDFNRVGLPNTTPANRPTVAGQALSSFIVGRTSSNAAGVGGLVVSAASESVNALVRALQVDGRLQILSRPVVTTQDGKDASLQVGQSTPIPTNTTVTNNTTTNGIDYRDVGIIMEVLPTVGPDGLISIQFGVEKSSRGMDLSVGNDATAPEFNVTEARTTINAFSGQTVVFAGLITTDEETSTRTIPHVGNIPILGRLFRFDTHDTVRRELLIVMTPHLIQTQDDLDYTLMSETERMSWCLADVVNLYGDVGFTGSSTVIHPYQVPTAPQLMPQQKKAMELVPPQSSSRRDEKFELPEPEVARQGHAPATVPASYEHDTTPVHGPVPFDSRQPRRLPTVLP